MDAYSGCLIKQGQIIIEVKKKYTDSTVSKILELITSGGEKKSKADEFVAKFSKYYTPIIVIVAILAIIIFGIVDKKWDKSVCQGLEILVAGLPLCYCYLNSFGLFCSYWLI
jgi:Cd2+/Zn2+-exporting ATPase